MSNNIKTIGAAVAQMFEQKSDADAAAIARTERLPRIIEAKRVITQEMLAAMAADEMPENTEITREMLVAVAQLAMRALQLVETVVEVETASASQKH